MFSVDVIVEMKYAIIRSGLGIYLNECWMDEASQSDANYKISIEFIESLANSIKN